MSIEIESQNTNKKELLMKDYWLGSLSPEIFEELEIEWYCNNSDSNLLKIIRNELFEDYFTNSLTVEDKKLFEQNFLSDEENIKELALFNITRKSILANSEKQKSMFAFGNLINLENIKNKFSLIFSPQFAFASISVVLFGISAFWVINNYLLKPDNDEIAKTEVTKPVEILPANQSNQGDKNEPPIEPTIPEITNKSMSKPDNQAGNTNANTKTSKNINNPKPTELEVVSNKKQVDSATLPKDKEIEYDFSQTVTMGSASSKQINIPKNTKTLILKFQRPILQKDFSESYAIEIKNKTTGSSIWKYPLKTDLNQLTSDDIFPVRIPADYLHTGEYEILVIGNGKDKTSQRLLNETIKITRKP
jgi:hypothetical protein